MARSRRDAIREFHESDRPMGVYRVRGVSREVIGSSVDVRAALNRQRAQLDLNAHPDKDLQREWDESGPDAFAFDVLDTLDPTDDPDHDPRPDLRELETMWRERLAGE